MKAAVWHARRDLRVDEIPEPPTPGPHDVKIRVDWCGICGTDLEEYANGPMYIPVTQPNPLTGGRAPLVIGHEFVGTIVQAGSAVEHLSVGDRVAPDTLLFCRECPPCRAGQVHQCERLAIMGLMADGGCAELVNAPAYKATKDKTLCPRHLMCLVN
jgi:(R,R)-butanediol dehydrogenase/meso-butanediol dehydrogenase/diacetyl reductase